MTMPQHRKRICIIHTGGTIGMKPSNQGYVPAQGFLSTQLDTMSELKHADMPDYQLFEMDPLIDSANATPAFWGVIANLIAANYHQYDGFVILHGTDTMAYTASALSFMLENLSKPIILTGAQIPIACIPSDARDNLINALSMASHYAINEVCIYFNHALYRGNRARKKSAVNYSAFESPNFPILGDVSAEARIHTSLLLPKPTGDFALTPLTPIEASIIRLFPGLSNTYLKHVLQHPLQTLIIESYGVGNAPDDPHFLNLLSDAIKRGVIIVNCTQCPHGGVKTEIYATGYTLSRAGVISAIDMTVEATIAKLTYLFSLGLPNEDIKRQLSVNLRGEITTA